MVKRYDQWHHRDAIDEMENGDYVLHSDYAALAERCERLEAKVEEQTERTLVMLAAKNRWMERTEAAERRIYALEDFARSFLEAADARDNEETATQYPDHERRLSAYKAAREDLSNALTKESP